MDDCVGGCVEGCVGGLVSCCCTCLCELICGSGVSKEAYSKEYHPISSGPTYIKPLPSSVESLPSYHDENKTNSNLNRPIDIKPLPYDIYLNVLLSAMNQNQRDYTISGDFVLEEKLKKIELSSPLSNNHPSRYIKIFTKGSNCLDCLKIPQNKAELGLASIDFDNESNPLAKLFHSFQDNSGNDNKLLIVSGILISTCNINKKASALATLYIDSPDDYLTYNNIRLLIFHCFLASVVYLPILSLNHKKRRVEIIEYLNVLAKAGEKFVMAISSKIMKSHSVISKNTLIDLLTAEDYQYLLNSSTLRIAMLLPIMRKLD